MNNNNIWGPPAWTFLHTITFNFHNVFAKINKIILHFLIH